MRKITRCNIFWDLYERRLALQDQIETAVKDKADLVRRYNANEAEIVKHKKDCDTCKEGK